GDEIVVATGTYIETLFVRGKNIHLRSTAPLSERTVRYTIIDGRYDGPLIPSPERSCVKFSGTETEECVVEGFTFTGARSSTGGGLDGGGAHATVRNCRFISLSGLGRKSDYPSGGAINDLDGLIEDNFFFENFSEDGGAVSHCDGTIRGNHFEQNMATGVGGYKVYYEGKGGALYNCDGRIIDNDFVSNECLRSGNPIGGGGAMYGCDGWIEGNRFESNTAPSGGALLACHGAIIGNRFENNQALEREGGAVSNSQGPIVDNEFIGNIANSGGALHNCSGLISGNHFFGNECFLSVTIGALGAANVSYARGGALEGCVGLIERNLFIENRAVGGTYRGGLGSCEVAGAYGGAISGGTGTLRNNLFIQNECVTGDCGSPDPNPGISRGGAICGFEGEIVHNTFVENRGVERGGALDDCPGAVRNNIFWLNTADEGAQIQNGSLPDHCLIQDWTGDGIGNINLDPRFVDPENGDFHLRHDSPCIDSGVLIASVTDDYDGNSRPFVWSTQYGGDGSAYDMGAYEFYPGPDVNYDQIVDEMDLFIFQQDWLAVSGPESSKRLVEVTDLSVDQTVWKSTTPPDIFTPSGMATDLDGNGEVDVHDLLELLEGMR
ncbi:MAG: hypothetical protein KC944_09690, partial [Candidatus Omnitrophica bacterium]|nr:hypothetical protein [Candidatus Omnitrophota bacterium]